MFRQMGLGAKVAGGFALVLLLLLVTNIISYVNSNVVSQGVEIDESIVKMQIATLEARREEKNYQLRKDKKYIHNVKTRVEVIRKQAGELKGLLDEADDKQQMGEIVQAAEKYQQAFLRYVDLYAKPVEPDKKAQHEELLRTLDKEMVGAARSLQKMTYDAEDMMDKTLASYISFFQTMLIVLTLLALVLGTLAAFFLTRSITKPVNRVIAGLSEGSEQVASASAQVSSASQSLAEGAQEQAAGLEETSSSIEELSSMTRQNAENANQANIMMADTAKVVTEANLSMKELTLSMKEISAASEETAKIIKTIDEIAFQTNLLALNAAVEAARAGEAGAGFAVVADEVRNLAIRAAEAAKNTAGLIEGTVKRIKNGSDIVSRTDEAFGKVSLGSKKVGELVGEIAAASQEQAQGIEQISRAIAEMDKVVQSNASGAEESASAAEELSGQAEMMKGFVGELVALVGGHAERGLAVQSLSPPIERSLPRPVKALGMVQVPARRSPALKAREVKPDQVIPMGKDGFKDF